MQIDIEDIAAPFIFDLEMKWIDFEYRMELIKIKQEIIGLRYMTNLTKDAVINMYVHPYNDGTTTKIKEYINNLYDND